MWAYGSTHSMCYITSFAPIMYKEIWSFSISRDLNSLMGGTVRTKMSLSALCWGHCDQKACIFTSLKDYLPHAGTLDINWPGTKAGSSHAAQQHVCQLWWSSDHTAINCFYEWLSPQTMSTCGFTTLLSSVQARYWAWSWNQIQPSIRAFSEEWAIFTQSLFTFTIQLWSNKSGCWPLVLYSETLSWEKSACQGRAVLSKSNRQHRTGRKYCYFHYLWSVTGTCSIQPHCAAVVRAVGSQSEHLGQTVALPLRNQGITGKLVKSSLILFWHPSLPHTIKWGNRIAPTQCLHIPGAQ
jgi:hypothetical protein